MPDIAPPQNIGPMSDAQLQANNDLGLKTIVVGAVVGTLVGSAVTYFLPRFLGALFNVPESENVDLDVDNDG